MALVTSKRVAAAALVSTIAGASPARADERDESVATLLALGGTLSPILIGRGMAALPDDTPGPVYGVGAALLLGGLVVGPSAGHWYADELATTGLAVRGGGLLAMLLGVVTMPCMGDECGGGDDDDGEGRLAGGITLLLAGAAAVVVGDIIDLADADDAARRYNDSHVGSAPRTHMVTIGTSF